MSHSEAKSTSTVELTIKLTPEMREQHDRLGAHYGKPIEELARDFFAEELEAQIERHEDQAIRELITRRAPDAEFVQGTPEIVNDIERQYRRLTAGE